MKDRHIIVIGGGSGIGRAVALAAASGDARVTIVGRRREALEATARGAALAVHVADVAVETEVIAMYHTLGGFDHLICTATQSAAGKIGAVANAQVAAAIATKLWAPFYLVAHGRNKIASDGSFTFFSGIRGARPAVGSAITSLVNGGLEAFARALALELAPVRVNVVSPGVVDSGAFWDRLGEARRDQLFADYAAKAPAGRVGTPEDIAAATLFAMANPFLTGTVLAVDGGGLLV